MRYAKDHKEKTRQRLIETAARSIRRNGVSGTGVIGLASELGLTQGALYSHFESKEALMEAGVTEAMRQMRTKIARVLAEARSAETSPISALIAWYLSPKHREEKDEGCLVSALGGELARQPIGTRRAAMSSLDEVFQVLAAEMPGGSPGAAMALYAMMAGSLQLARVAVTTDERDAILAGGRAAAHAFVSSLNAKSVD